MTATDLRPSPEIRNVNTRDGTVLLDITQGLCFTMNPVGARIWEMLKLNHSREEIVQALSGDYGVPREQVAEDVDAFLSQLRGRNLVVGTDEAQRSGSGLLHRIFHRKSTG